MLEALAAEPDPPTTERTPAAALRAHVADGLSGLEVDELRQARRVADLGSGAGFPGLVLAAARPEMQVDLVESAARKCAVIDRLIRASAIENARSVRARAEEWGALPAQAGGGAGGYDVVTARALGSLALLEEYAAPLLRDGGVLVAWKGERDPAEEEAGRRSRRGARDAARKPCSRWCRSRGRDTATCMWSERWRPRRRASRGAPGWPASGRSADRPRTSSRG